MENEIVRNLPEILTDALRMKGISVEKLAQLTGISERFLTLLFEEKWSKLPAAPYVRGFLIRIAETLNLNGDDLWAAYVKDNEVLRRAGKKDLLPGNRFVVPKINFKIALPIAIALILVVYLAFRIPSLFGGSSLSIRNIPPELVVAQAEFTVEGTVDPSDRLAIDGETVYPKTDGSFEHAITLHPGFNTIEFSTKRFLGKEEVISKQIYYQVATSTPSKNASQESK